MSSPAGSTRLTVWHSAPWVGVGEVVLVAVVVGLALESMNAGTPASVAVPAGLFLAFAVGVGVATSRTHRRVATVQRQRGALAAVAGAEQPGQVLYPEASTRRQRAHPRPVVLTADDAGVTIVSSPSIHRRSQERVLPYSTIWGVESRRVNASGQRACLLVLTDRSGWQLRIKLAPWTPGERVDQLLAVLGSHTHVARQSTAQWSHWTT